MPSDARATRLVWWPLVVAFLPGCAATLAVLAWPKSPRPTTTATAPERPGRDRLAARGPR